MIFPQEYSDLQLPVVSESREDSLRSGKDCYGLEDRLRIGPQAVRG